MTNTSTNIPVMPAITPDQTLQLDPVLARRSMEKASSAIFDIELGLDINDPVRLIFYRIRVELGQAFDHLRVYKKWSVMDTYMGKSYTENTENKSDDNEY